MSTSCSKSGDKLTPARQLPELAPPDYVDPVIEAYKKDVDRTLLRENLKLSVEERIRRAQQFHAALDELRQAGADLLNPTTREGPA